MRELAQVARKWAAQGRTGVLGRPIVELGFGPRNLGDAVLIGRDGICHGTLYRGACDEYLASEAAILPPGHTACVREVSVHHDGVARAGLTRGGQAEVLLQPLHSLPALWWDLLAEGAGAALVTWLDGTLTRAVSSVVTADRQAGASAEIPVQGVERARELLSRRRPGRDTVPADDGLVLVEIVPAPPHLNIVGDGELARLLLAQARLLGWPATVVSSAQDATRLLTTRPDGACLIMLSRDPGIDVPVLHTALVSGAAYVGALGSRRTHQRRVADLISAGLDMPRINRLHGPIGLDLGARSPAETALAICAEVLAALDGREPRALRGRPGPVNA